MLQIVRYQGRFGSVSASPQSTVNQK